MAAGAAGGIAGRRFCGKSPRPPWHRPCIFAAIMLQPQRGVADLPWILVADADREAGTLLAGHLARRGLHASHTTLGSEVLALAASGRLAVAIVDVALGDMSGHALVARLKAVDPGLHVLMTTADYRPEFEVRARQIGILHYAQKPTDHGRLEAVVAKALGASRPD